MRGGSASSSYHWDKGAFHSITKTINRPRYQTRRDREHVRGLVQDQITKHVLRITLRERDL